MKKILLIVALALCLVGTARAEDPNDAVTLWVSGSNFAYQNTELGTMLGFYDGKSRVEAGFVVDWRVYTEGDTTDDSQSNLAIGPYVCYHLGTFIDVNNPGIPLLPDKLIGSPFISLAYPIDTDGKGAVVRPAVGVRVFDAFALTGSYDIITGAPANNEWRIGFSLQYKI